MKEKFNDGSRDPSTEVDVPALPGAPAMTEALKREDENTQSPTTTDGAAPEERYLTGKRLAIAFTYTSKLHIKSLETPD
jgi:hypothetical protein